MSKYRFVEFSEVGKDIWDDFCLKNLNGWYWHTSWRIDHILNSSGQRTAFNFSFCVYENDKLVALTPLVIDRTLLEDGKIRVSCSYVGKGTPFPLISDEVARDHKNELINQIFNRIFEICRKESVSFLDYALSLTLEQIKTEPFYFNYLTSYGFNDDSIYTMVLDLNLSLTLLFENLSQSHKRSIKKASKLLTYEVVDDSNVKLQDADHFRDFYFYVAGKKTHPDYIFRSYLNNILNGNSCIVRARYEGQVVGLIYVITYKNSAYYLQGANDPSFDLCPIGHYLHWSLITHLKSKGYTSYEIGHQYFQPYGKERYSQKELDIARFKRGFGGIFIPYFRGSITF